MSKQTREFLGRVSAVWLGTVAALKPNSYDHRVQPACALACSCRCMQTCTASQQRTQPITASHQSSTRSLVLYTDITLLAFIIAYAVCPTATSISSADSFVIDAVTNMSGRSPFPHLEDLAFRRLRALIFMAPPDLWQTKHGCCNRSAVCIAVSFGPAWLS
jgi:hypothetical protein